MLVKDWISATPITVDADASVGQAIDLLNNNHLSMLPVMQDGKLVGAVTDLNLKPLALSGGLSLGGLDLSLVLRRIRVSDVMSRAPVTVPLDYSVEETAEVMLYNDVPGVVVIDHSNQVLGVFTQADTNRVLVAVTGHRRGGIVLGFVLEDRPGSIKELTDILRAHGGRLASILSSYERTPKGQRRVHIRVRGLDRAELPVIREELGKKARLLYVIDLRENRRELFEDVNL
ncbi:CBS domain-containing protein [Syntrophobacter fumaroxidans]|uniref:Putative signal transduction protein with CBS domains n=1 Tax=Syntrophobacter fumaroxidans (strain DSM 10017 / MPOB) TaxID=335543 RepID=A0LQB9_SYNFM|nr:CBS domain-containing protein [Syntrophobacter fumaroxidans]ABK19621.1 putative signal transduction protein with CBS domains [Syntrophobacter fumaroxidans MPOB]